MVQTSILRQAVMRHRESVMEPFDILLEGDSFDALCHFSEMVGGGTLYIPTVKTIFLHCLELEAQREFNGGNYRALARKYGLSESHLRKVINRRP